MTKTLTWLKQDCIDETQYVWDTRWTRIVTLNWNPWNDQLLKALFFTIIIPWAAPNVNVKDLLKDTPTKWEPIWKDIIWHIILISLHVEDTFERRPTCIKLIFTKMELKYDSFWMFYLTSRDWYTQWLRNEMFYPIQLEFNFLWVRNTATWPRPEIRLLYHRTLHVCE